jgi:uncharacterized protein (TIGR00269 family)
MANCSNCGRKAVVKLRSAHADYCQECFCNRFEKRVLKAIREFKLVERGDGIAVGISGGKDSSAMLFVLSGFAKKMGFEVFPILIDEGINGYRSKSIKEAEKLCRKLGLELRVFSCKKRFGKSVDDAIAARDEKKLGLGACSICGAFRKTLLNEAALSLKADKLAIGHNADDSAQTLLMNLMRRDSRGLEWFGEVSGGDSAKRGFVKRIKPLIFVTERECALYCDFRNLPHYLGECPFAGEAMRGEVKDFLNEVEDKHPGTKFNLVHSLIELRKARKSSNKKGGEKAHEMLKCKSCGGNSSKELCKACEILGQLD